MFGDWNWIESRTSQQYENMKAWLKNFEDGKGNLLLIEIGAGTAVPTVRHQCESIARQFDGDLVRINPREADGPNVISIETGGLEALEAIDQLVVG